MSFTVSLAQRALGKLRAILPPIGSVVHRAMKFNMRWLAFYIIFAQRYMCCLGAVAMMTLGSFGSLFMMAK